MRPVITVVDNKPTDFTLYAVGICAASVCANRSLSKGEIAKRLNEERPTGISSRWKIAKEGFKTGEPNPCPCNEWPETHQHWLLHC